MNLANCDFVKIVVSHSVIYEKGLSRRVFAGRVYQHLHWEKAEKGHVIINDEKGCSLEVPSYWVAPHKDDE